MTADRITADLAVSDLAAAITEWVEADGKHDHDATDAASCRIRLLAPLVEGIHPECPTHALLKAALAVEDLMEVADRALGEADRITVTGIENQVNAALLTLAKKLQPAPDANWATIIEFYVGDVGEPTTARASS